MDNTQEIVYMSEKEVADLLNQQSEETIFTLSGEVDPETVANEGNRKLMDLLEEFNLKNAFDALNGK